MYGMVEKAKRGNAALSIEAASNGELAVRRMSEKAKRGYDMVKVYEFEDYIEDDSLPDFERKTYNYSVRGEVNTDNLTFNEVQDILERYSE